MSPRSTPGRGGTAPIGDAPRKRINATLDPKLLADVDAICRQQGISRSSAINIALALWVGKQPQGR